MSRSLSETLADVSVERLNAQKYLDADWATLYRDGANALGFQHGRGLLASAAFNDCFIRLFGTALLHELGCPLATNAEAGWPALMLRRGVNEPFAPVKHVLMAAFYAMAPSRNTEFVYERPGKKRPNMQAIDAQLAQIVRSKWAGACQQRSRLTVSEVMGSARAFGVFRHNRTDMPLTSSTLEQFRKSDQSARQVGRRPRFRSSQTSHT